MTSGWSADFLQGASGAWKQQHLQQHEQLAERLAFLRQKEAQLEAELQRVSAAALREPHASSLLPPHGGEFRFSAEEVRTSLPASPRGVPLPGVSTFQEGGLCPAAFPRSAAATQASKELASPAGPQVSATCALLSSRSEAELEMRGLSSHRIFAEPPSRRPTTLTAAAPDGDRADAGDRTERPERRDRGEGGERKVCFAEKPRGGEEINREASSLICAEGGGGLEDEGGGGGRLQLLEQRRMQLLQEKATVKEMQQQYGQLLEELQQQQQQRQQQLLFQLQPPEGLHCGPAGKQALRQFFEQAYMLSRPSCASTVQSSSSSDPRLSSSPCPAKAAFSSFSAPNDLPSTLSSPASLFPSAAAVTLPPTSSSTHPVAFLPTSSSPVAPHSAWSSGGDCSRGSPPLLSNVSPALVVCRRWQATQGLGDSRAAALVSLLRAMGVKRNATYRGVFETALRPKLILRALKLRSVLRRFFGDTRRGACAKLAGDSPDREGVDLARLKARVVPHLGPHGETVWSDWLSEEGAEKNAAEAAKRFGAQAPGSEARAAQGSAGQGCEEQKALFAEEEETGGERRLGGGLPQPPTDGERTDHEALRAIDLLYRAVNRLAPMFQVRPLQPILAAMVDALQPLPLPPAVLKLLLDDTPAARDFYKIAHTQTKHLIWLQQPWKFFAEVSDELDACVAILNATSGVSARDPKGPLSLSAPACSKELGGEKSSGRLVPGLGRQEGSSRGLDSSFSGIEETVIEGASPGELLEKHIQRLLDLVDGNPAIYSLLMLFLRLKFILSLLPPREYVIDLRTKAGKNAQLAGPALLPSGGEKGWGGAAGGHYIPIVRMADGAEAASGFPRRCVAPRVSSPEKKLEAPLVKSLAGTSKSQSRSGLPQSPGPAEVSANSDPDSGVCTPADDGDNKDKQAASSLLLPEREGGVDGFSQGDECAPDGGGQKGSNGDRQEREQRGERDQGGSRGSRGAALELGPGKERSCDSKDSGGRKSCVSRARLAARLWPQAECQWSHLRCLLAVGYRDRFHCDDAEMRSVDASWALVTLVAEVIKTGTNSRESLRRRDDLLKPAKTVSTPTAETAEKGLHIKSSNDLLDVCLICMHPLFLQAVAEALAFAFYRPDFHPLIFRSQERIWRAFAVLGLSAPYVGLTKFILESRPSGQTNSQASNAFQLQSSSAVHPTAPLSPSASVGAPALPLSLDPAVSLEAAPAAATPASSARSHEEPSPCVSSSHPSPAGRRESFSLETLRTLGPSRETSSTQMSLRQGVHVSGEDGEDVRERKLAGPDEVASAQNSSDVGPAASLPSSLSLRAAAAPGGDAFTSAGTLGSNFPGFPGPSFQSAPPSTTSPSLPPEREGSVGFPPCPPSPGVRALGPPGPGSCRLQKRDLGSVEADRLPGGKAPDDPRQKRRKAGGGLDIPLSKLVAYAAGSSSTFSGSLGVPPTECVSPRPPVKTGLFWRSLEDLTSTQSFLSAYLPRFHSALYTQSTQRLQAFFDLARAAATASSEERNCSLAEAVAAAALAGSECDLLSASASWSAEDNALKLRAVPSKPAALLETLPCESGTAGAPDSQRAAAIVGGLKTPQGALLKDRLRELAREAAGAWLPGLGAPDLPRGGHASTEEEGLQDAHIPLDCLSATIAALTLPHPGESGLAAATQGSRPDSGRCKEEDSENTGEPQPLAAGVSPPAHPVENVPVGEKASETADALLANLLGKPLPPVAASPREGQTRLSLPPLAKGAAVATAGTGGVVAFCARFRAAVQNCGDEGVCRRLLVAGRTEIVLARLVLTCLLPLTSKSEAFRALQHSILRRVASQAQTLLLLSSEKTGRESEGAAENSEETESHASRDSKAPEKKVSRGRLLSLAEVDWLFLMTLRTFVRLASLPHDGDDVPGSPLDREGGSAESMPPGFFWPNVLVELTKLLSLLAERHPLFLQFTVDLLKVPAVVRAVGARASNLLMHAWKQGKQHFSKRPRSAESLMFAKSFGEAMRLSRVDISPAELAELTGLPGVDLPPSHMAASTDSAPPVELLQTWPEARSTESGV
ncbi:hypothetical protein TGME49_310720 [Toxoplasma gondii ME49]|uniref:Uncharacterized protein n=2 Tax=Toxoplasma gondii TaxID=5811 RepID=A0A125YY05_TOXGV|nr:hypothetical protein TGME49_310720 [Toxoplasma gondii ME49]EPT26158.1 hypothetical protein TGME49_310720 [Toxoplasma gondii ME49]ESS34954.1 hypothetical protein TGVEG_310720 [Toxoplasma gondii VEG]|eukprot:XP_018635553.1 hypothetical protein TGME49_310720 [Toxoplasma gondii ME49]